MNSEVMSMWFGPPDSELCRAAVEYARAVSEPFLFNHVMRSGIYADLIGQARKVRYDREIVWISAVLHDLGLTRIAPAQTRFEIEGADSAHAFLASRGLTERQLEIVWDAIALHTTAEIPLRKSPEISLCHLGTAADLSTAAAGALPGEAIDSTLKAYPWLNLTDALPASLVALYAKNPGAAASGAVADACDRHLPNFKRFNFFDHLVDHGE